MLKSALSSLQSGSSGASAVAVGRRHVIGDMTVQEEGLIAEGYLEDTPQRSVFKVDSRSFSLCETSAVASPTP